MAASERIDVLAVDGQAILADSAIAYLNVLAAEIAAKGDPNGDLLTEAISAHERRQCFASEIADGSTRRAKLVRRVACAGVFAAVNVRAELEELEREQDEATCKQSLQVASAALARVQGEGA